MINNLKLNQSIQKAITEVFVYLNNQIDIYSYYSLRETPDLMTNLVKFKSTIEQIPEFIESVKVMREDEKISSLENQAVGTFNSMANIGSMENFLYTFLRKLYINKRDYSDEEIQIEYSKFENFIYSPTLLKRETTRLFNFDCSENEIDFGGGVKIIKIDDTDPIAELQTMLSNFDFSVMYRSNYVIQRIFETSKITSISSNFSEKITESLQKEYSDSEVIFESVVKSLRILKSSGVYTENKIQVEDLSFSFIGGNITRFKLYQDIVHGEKCEIKSCEIPELVSIFKYVNTEKDSRFGVASRRLNIGIERRNIEDKLIDYMIGLETLYLPDSNAELTFRLSLRVAFLLAAKNNDRKDLFKFIKTMYDQRSKIVHGSNYSITNEELSRLESTLRNSIKLWVNDKSNFIAKSTNSGRDEGKLNTMFFE